MRSGRRKPAVPMAGAGWICLVRHAVGECRVFAQRGRAGVDVKRTLRSAPTTVALARTGVRAEAIVSLRLQDRLHRPERTTVFLFQELDPLQESLDCPAAAKRRPRRSHLNAATLHLTVQPPCRPRTSLASSGRRGRSASRARRALLPRVGAPPQARSTR